MDHGKTGQFIAACRKSRHLTQKELADRLGVTNKAVSKWETGQGMPDISVLLELGRILGVSVEEILEGEQHARQEDEERNDRFTGEKLHPYTEVPEETIKCKKKSKSIIWVILDLLLLAAGSGLCILQIWYICRHDSYRIEYMAQWMFYAVNGTILLCFFFGGICLRKPKTVFRKPAVVLLFVFAFLANLAAAFLLPSEDREIISLSQGFPKNCMVLKIHKDNGTARLYRPAGGPFFRSAEELPFTVKGEVKLQWLEKDVCTVTYQSGENERVHQFAACYGDRGDGISYYNVDTVILGTWLGEGGYYLSAESGSIRLTTPRGVEEYDYEQWMQYGTLALVFPKESPRWTLVLNKDCILKSGQDTLEDGGTITLCRVSMKKTAPVLMKRIMDGESNP